MYFSRLSALCYTVRFAQIHVLLGEKATEFGAAQTKAAASETVKSKITPPLSRRICLVDLIWWLNVRLLFPIQSSLI